MPIISVFAIFKVLLPLIRDLIKAASKNSRGGKKVTTAEVEDILVDHLPILVTVLVDKLNK